jgi:glutamate racemase
VASRYLKELMDQDIDTLILGCTHYPLLRSTIQELVGERVTLVNPAYETARGLKELLKEANLENPRTDQDENGRYRFYVSDLADKFKGFANSILPFDIERISQINIEEY